MDPLHVFLFNKTLFSYIYSIYFCCSLNVFNLFFYISVIKIQDNKWLRNDKLKRSKARGTPSPDPVLEGKPTRIFILPDLVGQKTWLDYGPLGLGVRTSEPQGVQLILRWNMDQLSSIKGRMKPSVKTKLHNWGVKLSGRPRRRTLAEPESSSGAQSTPTVSMGHFSLKM